VDDRDDVSEVETDASTFTSQTKVNNIQLSPDMMIQALEGMGQEQREEFFDKILQKDF